MFKKLKAKRALPRKQAVAIQPTETFFDNGEKKENQLTIKQYNLL